MKLHRVYYKELSRTDKISIDNKSKINHLRNVLRLSEGSKLDVFDGAVSYTHLTLPTKRNV